MGESPSSLYSASPLYFLLPLSRLGLPSLRRALPCPAPRRTRKRKQSKYFNGHPPPPLFAEIKKQVEKRFTADQLLQHPFIQTACSEEEFSAHVKKMLAKKKK